MSDRYVMGQSERERRRLQLQASLLNPLTERFLREAGISRGMRVLDLGCGAGDVTMIAAALAGPEGEVIGIDTAEQSLEVARERAADEGFSNITFVCTNLMDYRPGRSFDAVIGRHILIHTKDACAVVARAASLLVAGGIAAFQEYDLSFWKVSHPDVPLAAGLAKAIVELFQRAGAHPDAGMRVYHFMLEAGLANPHASAESLMEGGPDTLFYEWFAETVCSVLPAMRAMGIPSATGDEATLPARMRQNFITARACLASPLIVSTSARKI